MRNILGHPLSQCWMVGGHKLWNETLKLSVMHSKTLYLTAECEAEDVHADGSSTVRDMYNKLMLTVTHSNSTSRHLSEQIYNITFCKRLYYVVNTTGGRLLIQGHMFSWGCKLPHFWRVLNAFTFSLTVLMHKQTQCFVTINIHPFHSERVFPTQ